MADERRDLPSDHPKRVTVAPALRPLYFVAGLVCVGLGYLGFVLPVMPGTIFLILALAAFRRSSPPLERWLLARPVIGPILQDWDERGAIRPRTKTIIHVVLWLSIIGSAASAYRHWPVLPASAVCLALVAVASGVSWFVATRPDA